LSAYGAGKTRRLTVGLKTLKAGTFAIVVLLALMGATGVAGAKKKKEKAEAPAPGPVLTVSDTVTVPAFNFLVTSPTIARATCPGGTEVVSGGYSLPEPSNPPTGVATVTASRRSGAAGWVATAINLNLTPSTVTVHAYCRANVKALTTIAETDLLPAAVSFTEPAFGTVVATCPAGQRAVSGGVISVAGFAGSGVIESRRTAAGDGWSTTAGNPQMGPTEITVLAYCTEAEVFTAPLATAVSSNAPVETFSATASGCPTIEVKTEKKKKKKKGKNGKKGKNRLATAAKKKKKKKKKTKTKLLPTQVVSGGYRTNLPDTAPPDINLTTPYDQSIVGGAWRVRATHNGDVTGTLTAEAYCMA
jgi:hypothetical protein